MKKIFILTIFYCSFINSVLPPGSCKNGEIQVTAAGLRGGQCVSEKNLSETLFYLNQDLNLDVNERELVRACNELKEENIDSALSYLKLDSVNALQENKMKVLKAACNALNFGFLPVGPQICEVPGCPTDEPCTKNEWIVTKKDNFNCQKPGLNGKCLEYAECPLY